MTVAKAAPRIFWAEDDNEKLSARLWEIGVHSAKHPNLLQIVRDEQHRALEPDRIRTHLVGINHIRKFVEYFGEYAKRKHKATVRIVPRTKPEPAGVDIDAAHAPQQTVNADDAPRYEPVIEAAPPPQPELPPITEPQLVRTAPPPKEPEALVPPAPPPQPHYRPQGPLITEAMLLALSDSADAIMETLAGSLAERFVKHLRRALHDVADREVAAFLHGTAEPIGATAPVHAPPSIVARSETAFVPADVPVPTAAPMDDRPEYAPEPTAHAPHDAPDHLAHLDPPPPSEVVPNAHPFRREEAPRATLAVPPREKRRVAMIGLPPGQLHNISNETRRRLDIKMIDQNLSQSELQNKIANCDVVIGAWGLGKVARGVARNHPNFIQIDGGMTQLKRILDNMQ